MDDDDEVERKKQALKPFPGRMTEQNFFGPDMEAANDTRKQFADLHGPDVADDYFKLPKSIAVIAWGAVAWDPGNLPLVCEDQEHPETAFSEGGPEVPVEFSRIAVDCRLVPVIDPENGVPVPTLWARSRRNDLDAAIVDLMRREGSTNPKRIGFVDVRENRHRARISMDMAEPVKAWAKEMGVDCVIWTELTGNFKDHIGRPFTLDNAYQYLAELPKSLRDQARIYIERSPECVETPLRAKLRDEGWPE